MDLPELIRQVSLELQQEFEEKASLISHPGESGTAREQALRDVLSTYLPQRYGVDAGFVLDSNLNESDQLTLSSMIKIILLSLK